MRGMLEPMFGEWGTLTIQFLITAVVVLGLVGLVYWLVRRYSIAGLGRIGRGRVPRLAIVDAMSVDGRRRLVLVRRDNVEHLILIGGPSDVVVEQAIQRPRRPKAVTPPAEAEPVEPAPSEPGRVLENELIPFPQPRAQHVTGRNGSEIAAPRGAGNGERPFSFRRNPETPSPTLRSQPNAELPAPAPPARFLDLQRPTRIEAEIAAVPSDEEAVAAPVFPDLRDADPPPPDVPAPMQGNGGKAGRPSAIDLGGASPGAAPPSPFARPRPADDTAPAEVNDLEREMARLLGEITQKHPS